ncbi:MAG: extracellular solute-binding protein, partial [Nitrososphaerales archaeon]
GWMVLEAAGLVYANNQSYFANRMLTNHSNVTAASAAALVPSLQLGQIQFLLVYKSDIASERLNLIQLAGGINLGYSTYDTFYSQLTYQTASGLQRGRAIQLWLTVPKDSTDTNDSLSFVVYVIQNFQAVLKNFGLDNITPVQLYNDTGYSVPSQLSSLLAQGALEYSGAL